MNKVTSIITATALAGAVSATALVSASYAQAANGTKAVTKGPGQPQQAQTMNRFAQRGGGGFIGLVCSADGASRLETALANMTAKIDLTDEQKPLFDAFKTAYLTAQTDYADNCTRPQTREDAQNLSLVDRVNMRQHNLKAQVDAMDKVVPALDEFYNSLTEQQVAQLQTQARMGGGNRPGQMGQQGPARQGQWANRGGQQGQGMMRQGQRGGQWGPQGMQQGQRGNMPQGFYCYPVNPNGAPIGNQGPQGNMPQGYGNQNGPQGQMGTQGRMGPGNGPNAGCPFMNQQPANPAPNAAPGMGNGPANGAGNMGAGPADGTGNGAPATN